MCDDFIKGNCICETYICDLCYDYEYTKCYSLKTGLITDSANTGLYLTICSKCEVSLNSPFEKGKIKKIKDCIVKSYPGLKIKKKSKCCLIV